MGGIESLEQAADELADLDPASLSDEELGDVLVRWHRCEARFAASRAKVTSAFDLRGSWRADGSKTAAAWLARKCKASIAGMRARCLLARRLRHMPATRDALAAGAITERHAKTLGDLSGSPRKAVSSGFGDAEEQLVGHAKDLGFDEFQTAVRYWESLVDQDGVEDHAAKDHESRHVHLSETWRGMWVLDGQLDAVGGTELATALRRIDKEMFEADWAAAKEIHGDKVCVDHLSRTPAQRRADALVELARRAMAAPEQRKDPRPLFVVHLGDDSLKRMCELASGTVIAPGQLIPRLSEAEIERIVYEGPSRQVVDLGRKSRFFGGALLRAIQLRDRRCVHPGCDIPADDCQADHNTTPWAHDGRTDQNNGACRCARHNRHKGTKPPNYIDQPHTHDTS
jgi:Domain of unknown function (DUF222)